MKAKFLKKRSLDSFVKFLAREYHVFGPQKKDDSPKEGPLYTFVPLNRSAGSVDNLQECDLDCPITMLDAKKFFFPQKERLLKMKVPSSGAKPQADKIEVTTESDPIAIVGMHPCDIKAINQLDLYFTSDLADPYYKKRRENCFFVVDACKKLCSEWAFCASMGSYHVEAGYDLLLTELSRSGYAVEAGTPKGEEALDNCDAFIELNPSQVSLLAKTKKRIESTFHKEREFSVEGISDKMIGIAEDPIWREESSRCLACGSCNLVCPTCYCFDIHDLVHIDSDDADRIRQWDGCMLREFAEVAGGHNFRDSREARLRHRMYRKAYYLVLRYNDVFCVGCGRCAKNCLVDISPRTIFKRMEDVHAGSTGKNK